MKIDTRFQLAAFLICILATSIIGANSAFAFYDPPGNVPPGPPPNYNQIDTTYFAGAPVLPGVMEDSGGFYIWYDNTGAWNVANRIYKLTHGAENYHGSVLASMSAPPTPGVNVFATSFEIFDDSSSSYCYKQNDRWGWYQWDEGLYEIWWDVSTRSTAGQGDSTDYMKISILGCAIDFNVWSDDWDGRHFGPEYVFLGSSMTRLSDVPGFVDTYPGISDPYEADGHSGERNVSIYTRHSGNGNSYNKYGLITPDETHHCDNVLNDTYGSLFSGAFTYEGNGIQFSAGCVFNNCLNNTAPILQPPFNYNTFKCSPIQFCFDVDYVDDGNFRYFQKLSGPGTIDTLTGEVCFIPGPASQTYTFTILGADSCGLADTADYTVQVTLNSRPQATSPADQNLFVCDLSEIHLPGFSASDPDDNLVSINLVGGTLHGDTAYFTPVMGANTLTLIATDACGAADTSTTVVTINLNRPPEATSPANSEQFVCDLGQICLPGFDATDPDDNLVSKTLMGGTLHGDTACFIPVEGQNTLRLIAVDACGAADTAITIITITLNNPPIANSPDDTSLVDPTLAPICIPGFTAIDPDDNLVSTIVDGGTLSGDTVCFTPVAGINTLTLICTDACGAADTSVTHVTVSTGILLTVVGGAPPEFTEETTDSFFVQITGGDPGSLGFTSGFTAHLGHPDRYSSTLTDSLMKTVITFDYLDEFSSAQSPFAYRIIASDDYSADTLNLSLIVHDNNRTPTINSINDTTFTVGSTLAFDVNATDLDLDNTLTLSKVSGPGTFNSTPGLPPISGDFIWTPTISDIGPHQVIFTVDDGRGGIANDTVNINVVPSGIDLTVIGGAPPVFTEEIADSFFVSLGGYDPSGITFGASFTGHAGTPARYSAVQVDSLIKIVVTFDYLGEFSSANSPFAYRIIALDNYSADTLLLSLIVNDNNRNPEITVGSGYTVMVDHALTFSVTGADLDTDNSLTLSKVSGPGTFPGASGPSPITADFTWTPTIDDLSGSPYTVIFALGDGRGGVDTAAVTITVIPDGSPVIEIIHTPSVFHEGQLDSVVFRAHDPDGDPMGGFGFMFMPPAPDSTFPGVNFRTHGDSAFIRIVFDYLGPWSSSGSPFPMRLLAYSMRTTATVDSTILNISLEVINTNRKPELTVTGPHSIPAGSNVALDLMATDLDLDDVLTLSAANLPTGSSFVDHGGGAGNFDWSTVSGDTGSYQLRFYVNDNRNETNSRDTVLWDLTVTVPPPCEGLDSALLSIDDCATAVAPGSNVTVGINLLNACPVGGFEILIGTDPTALTLNSVSPTWRIDPDSDGYAEEYFNWVHDPIGPGTARFVWIYDTPEHGVGVPCDSGNGPILLLNYHVASGLPFGALIPVNFTYENDEDYSSNTLSDVTGNLFIHPLLDSGCVRIVDPAEYRGDPNMNCYEYEIADAVLVAQRLIYGFGVWAQDDDMPNTPPCDRHYPGNDNMQEAAGDLNDNGHPDIADLVRFINIINGFIYPKVDAAAGQASFYMDDGIVHVNSDVEIGGALVRIAHSGEIGTLVTSNGMDILYHDAEGVLTVLIYSTSSKRIPAGSQTLFTLDGAGAITDVSASDVYGELMQSRIGPPLPDAFRVEQNYPNPFNAKTLIKFDLPKESDVAINIYSITGRLVETLKSHFNAGEQSVTWDASNMASGIYFAKVTSEQNSRTVKMTLLK